MLQFMEVSQYVVNRPAGGDEGTGAALSRGRAGGVVRTVGTSLGSSGFPDGRMGGVARQGEASQDGLDAAALDPGSQVEGKVSQSGGQASEDGTGKARNNRRNFDSYECQTCKTRKYQDGSDDPGVSFKTPTQLSPDRAAFAVRAHEQEHVSREQASAAREGSDVVSQSVTYRTSICPECGSVYVAGGTTRTVTRQEIDTTYGLSQPEKGRYMDLTA